MSSETSIKSSAKPPLPKTLPEFVENAITDTPGLSETQIRSIRETVEPWYEYYRIHPPYLADALNFADTEIIRWQQKFFRQTLASYLTGWNSLEHIYYAIEAVMTRYFQVYLEKIRAADHPGGEQQPDVAVTNGAENDEALSLPGNETSPAARKKSRKRPATASRSAKLPPAGQEVEQFGLFG